MNTSLINAPIKSKLQHPPAGKLRAFDHFLCPRRGEFDLQGLPWGGDLHDLCLGVVGNIEPEVSVFFSGAEVANAFRRDGIN